jgi:hypothetical protein
MLSHFYTLIWMYLFVFPSTFYSSFLCLSSSSLFSFHSKWINHSICFIAFAYRFIFLCSTSLKSLSVHQLNLDIPCNSVSLLQNIAGIHVLAFGDRSLQSRLSFNLYYTLYRGKTWFPFHVLYSYCIMNWKLHLLERENLYYSSNIIRMIKVKDDERDRGHTKHERDWKCIHNFGQKS